VKVQFRFSTELAAAISRATGQLDRRRRLVELLKAQPARLVAAIAARDEAKREVDKLAANLALAELERSGSPRCSTMSTSTRSGRHSMRSNAKRPPGSMV
jgi:hypothetical protein